MINQTYIVHIQLCDMFEDMLVEAVSPEMAIEVAREKVSDYWRRWARFMV